MAVCHACGKRLGRVRHRRLAMPEYRAMTGFWPWLTIEVCDACVTAHDRNFRERVALLAPQVIENDEPVVRKVCLACGAAETDVAWHQAAKWLDARGRPARRCTFYLCGEHAGLAYVDGIVVSSNLRSREALAEVLRELPSVAAEMLARVEGWRPDAPAARGPAGALDFAAGRPSDQALADAWAFWQAAPEGLEAKAALLGPVRKDYRLRYRLDLVRDFSDGRRETLVVVRTGPDALATYRTAAEAPAAGFSVQGGRTGGVRTGGAGGSRQDASAAAPPEADG